MKLSYTLHNEWSSAFRKLMMVEQFQNKELAVLYISSISLFIGMCDRDPEQEEQVMRLIEKHVKEFNSNYRI